MNLWMLCEHGEQRKHQIDFDVDPSVCPGGHPVEGGLLIENADEFAGEFGLRLLRHDSTVSGFVSWQRAQAILLDMFDALNSKEDE